MSTKAQDRLATLRQKAQALSRQPIESAVDNIQAPDEDNARVQVPDDARTFFGAVSLDQLSTGRTIQRIPVEQIAPNLDPAMQQPRLLPLPAELLVDGEPAPQYRNLTRELLAFGRSLQERQIQPILVYAGTSPVFPGARYLILVGHRRWTAAHLIGLAALDALVVDPPSRADRVVVQYRENKDRSEFSDMELVWSLVQMREALGPEGTWEQVERSFGLGQARRQQLLRLNSFSADQQRQIARLRLQETQARALHEAARRGTLNERQIDQVLGRLAVIADERAAKDGADSMHGPRIGVDAPTVARLVAQAQRAVDGTRQLPSPKWVGPLRAKLSQTRTIVQRARSRVTALNEADATDMLRDIAILSAELSVLARAIQVQDSLAHGGDATDTSNDALLS